MPRKTKIDKNKVVALTKAAPKPEAPTIKFHSVKSALFRGVQADGAWGSINPQGNVHLIFYHERTPVPKEAVYMLTKDGRLNGEIIEKRVGKDGIIREMEVDVILSTKAAREVYAWLGNALNEIAQPDEIQP